MQKSFQRKTKPQLKRNFERNLFKIIGSKLVAACRFRVEISFAEQIGNHYFQPLILQLESQNRFPDFFTLHHTKGAFLTLLMLSHSKQMSGDVRKSAGNIRYDDMPPIKPIDYPNVEYNQSMNRNSSYDAPPPPAPPMHASRDISYGAPEYFDSEPPSDEEVVKPKSKKPFSNLFQKKKKDDSKRGGDKKTRARATSRASQGSSEAELAIAHAAYAYYPPALDMARAKPFGGPSEQPPPMMSTESYVSSMAASSVRPTTPASLVQDQTDTSYSSLPPIEPTPRHLKTRSMQDPVRALAELQQELNIKRQLLDQYRQENRRLIHEKERTHGTIEKREIECQKLLQNFDEYLQSVRATPDTLATISDRIRSLKTVIHDVVEELVAKADRKTATKTLRDQFWVNMEPSISKLGKPLKRPYITMLTEKYIMDQLVECVFCLISYPGLPIDQAYSDLFMWVEQQDEPFSIRLRQEMARVVASREKGDDTDNVVKQEKERVLRFLCRRLAIAFPFIVSHDKDEADPQKRYVAKFRRIVEQAFALSLAMKGQEVDITTGQILVGEQQFDPSIMVEEEGKDSGIVRFCIYPPFIDRTGQRRFLEKARVYCD